MAKVREMIQDALSEIGVTDPTMSVDATTANHALRILNRMLESWSNEDFYVYTENRQELPLTSGRQDYTLGDGAFFNFPRPVVITRASILITGTSPSPEIPIPILTTQEWQDVTVKQITGGFPTSVYITGDFPLQNLVFWPTPNVPCSFVLYYWGMLNAFTSLNDDVLLPKGYEDAIVSNLAVRLCPTYGRAVPQLTLANASASRHRLRETNAEPHYIGIGSYQSGVSSLKAIKSFGYVVD